MVNSRMTKRTRQLIRDSLNSSAINDMNQDDYFSISQKSRKLPGLRSKAGRPQTKQPRGNKMTQKNSMNYDEIKRVREEFNLERHEVYTLMSEFNSMLYMQENDSDNSDDEEFKLKHNKRDNGHHKDAAGISLKYFFEHTTFMKGILSEVNKIIVTALGLDADSPNTTISWDNYVILYCMLEKSTYRDNGIKFWCTFFDPHGFGVVPHEEYMSLLEKV